MEWREDGTLDSIVARTTGGRSARVIFDTVGGPTFEPALKALGHRGRQVEITSVGDRRMSFDLVNFHLPTDVFVHQVALIVPAGGLNRSYALSAEVTRCSA
jgi:NADPH:quinone reductase-like Zn-dependent oxidoreductase